MKGINNSLQNKWIAFAAATAVLFVVGIVLLILTTPPSPKKQLISNAIPTPFPSDSLKNNSQTYTSQTYTFSYPTKWAPIKLPLTNGGEFTTFRPVSQPNGAAEYYPSAVIAVEPSGGSSTIGSKVAIYTRFGMQVSTVPFLGMQATKVSGTFPIKFVNGIAVRGPVQKTLLFFERGGKVYTAKYYYEGDKVDPTYEQYFNQMLSTITFTQ